MNNILNEFNNSGLNFDRIVFDQFKLPYTFDGIELQPNELVTANTINLKFKKIYFNLLYLYGLCSIASFEIPNRYTGWAGITGRNTTPANQFKFQFFPYTTSSQKISAATAFLSGGRALSNIDDSYLATQFVNKGLDHLAIANRGSISIVSFDSSQNPTLVKNQSLIDPLSGSLFFQNIAGIAVDSNNTLYVSDKTLNNVYSYDLLDVVTDDYVKNQGLFLKNFIGGKGNKFDPLKFDNVGKLVYTSNNLIVEDINNKCFKVYDKNLVYVNTILSTELFNTVSAFNCLTYNTQENTVYGCSNKEVYRLNFDNDYQSLSSTSYSLASSLSAGEYLLDLKFANYDRDIMYLLTNTRILKKWLTKINYNIGISNSTNLSGRNLNDFNFFRWAATLPDTNTQDNLYIYTVNKSASSNGILIYEDGLNLISLLDHDINVYDLNDILIDEGEYVTSWVFNKSFKKILYNLLSLIQSIKYRFFEGVDNTNTPIFIKRGYNTFVSSFNMPDINTYVAIGINENFQAAVINRNLKKIYDLQNYMLEKIINNDTVLTNLTPKFIG